MTINPYIHHCHPLSEAHQITEYNCDACRTLGSGTSKRCDICRFDIHYICAKCPDEIPPPNIHPEHAMRLVFERKHAQAAAAASSRVCDVCGEEVDGLYYRCAVCDLDVHPICLQLPLEIPKWELHPEHRLRFGRYRGDTNTCMVCGYPCEFWWYRCVHSSCAAAKVDVHPECLAKTYGVAAEETRTLRPRPTHGQPQPSQQHNGGYPQPQQPSAPFFPCGDYRPPPDLHNIHLSSQQQPYYAPPHHHHQYHGYNHPHSPYLQGVYASHHSPPPHVLQHSYSVHGYHPSSPAVNGFGNPQWFQSQTGYGHSYTWQETASIPPTSPAYDSHGEDPNGKKRRRMYAVVAKILISATGAVTLGLFGIPSIFG